MKPSESLHRPDMKDVGFEEPAPEVLFDPKRDLHPVEIALIRREIRSQRTITEHDPSYDLFTTAAALSRLDASFKPLPEEINTNDLRRLQNAVQHWRGAGVWGIVAGVAIAAHTLNHSYDKFIGVKQEDIFQIRKLLMMLRADNSPSSWQYRFKLVHLLQVFDPTFDPEKEITDEDRMGMRNELRVLRNGEDTNSWQCFAELASFLHDCDPTFELQTEITQNDIARMRNQLQVERTSSDPDHWLTFARLASALLELSEAIKSSPLPSVEKPLPTVKTY